MTSDLPDGFVPVDAPADAGTPAPSPIAQRAVASIRDPDAQSMALVAATTSGLPQEAWPTWISAVHNESDWDPKVADNRNSNGTVDVGIGQLNSGTYPSLGLTEAQARDPQTNLVASARYFRTKWDEAGGEPALALTAYNAGNVRAPVGAYADKALKRIASWATADDAPATAPPPASASGGDMPAGFVPVPAAAAPASDLPPGFVLEQPAAERGIVPSLGEHGLPDGSTTPEQDAALGTFAAANSPNTPLPPPGVPVGPPAQTDLPNTPAGGRAYTAGSFVRLAPGQQGADFKPTGVVVPGQTQLGADASALGQGLVGGAASAIRGTGEAIGGGMTAAVGKGQQNARAQLGVLDRIDKGETVPATEDPLGYGDMSADQRQQFRAQYQQQLATMPAPDQTPIGGAGAAITRAATAAAAPLDRIAQSLPVDSRKEGFGTTVARGLGNLAPAVLAGLTPGGAAAVAGIIGTQSFDATYNDALAHNPDDQVGAWQSAAVNGAVQAGLMSVPLSGAIMRVADPVMRDGMLKTAINYAAHGITMESASEAGRFADNYIARASYDPDRDPLEGMGKDVAANVALGLLVPLAHGGAAGLLERGIEAGPELRNAVGGVQTELARVQQGDAAPAKPADAAGAVEPPLPAASGEPAPAAPDVAGSSPPSSESLASPSSPPTAPDDAGLPPGFELLPVTDAPQDASQDSIPARATPAPDLPGAGEQPANEARPDSALGTTAPAEGADAPTGGLAADVPAGPAGGSAGDAVPTDGTTPPAPDAGPSPSSIATPDQAVAALDLGNRIDALSASVAAWRRNALDPAAQPAAQRYRTLGDANRALGMMQRTLDQVQGRAEIASKLQQLGAAGEDLPFQPAAAYQGDDARLAIVATPRQPASLAAVMRQLGGVKPDTAGADDLRAMDLGRQPGFFNRSSRYSVEQMAVALRDRGYLGDQSWDQAGPDTTSAFDVMMQALDHEKSGALRWSNRFNDAADEAAASVRAYADGAQAVADRLGLSDAAAKQLTRGQVADAIASFGYNEDGQYSLRTAALRRRLRAADPNWATLPEPAKDARVRLTDVMQTFMRFAGLPDQVGLRLMDRIAGGAADGRYDPTLNSIDFALDTDWERAPAKFFHEIMHPMLELLPQAQQDAIRGDANRWLNMKRVGYSDTNRDTIRRNYAEQATSVGGWDTPAGRKLLQSEAVSGMAEQVMAEMFAPRTGVAQAIGSVGRFLNGLGNFMHGEGFRSGRAVLRAILDGERAVGDSAQRLRAMPPRDMPAAPIVVPPQQASAGQQEEAAVPKTQGNGELAAPPPAPKVQDAGAGEGPPRPGDIARAAPPRPMPVARTELGRKAANLLAPRDVFAEELGGTGQAGGAGAPGGEPAVAREQPMPSLDGSISGAADRGAYSKRDPLRRETEKDGQSVMPGAEASTRQALEKRALDPMRGKKPQKDMSAFDLFDPDARKQGSLFSLRDERPLVATVASNAIAAPQSPGRRAALEKWATANLRGQSFFSEALGAPIAINRVSIGKLFHRAGDDILSAVPAIPDVLRKGKLIGSVPERDPATSRSTKAWHYIGAGVEIDGRVAQFIARVREDASGNYFYSLGQSAPAELKAGDGGGESLNLIRQPPAPNTTIGGGSSDGNFSLRDEERVAGIAGFYSPVARAALDLKQARGTGEQILAMLGRAAGVKPEEMRWLGLDSWLRGQKSVTREQLLDYIRANSLDVQEVVKGDADPLMPEERQRFTSLSAMEDAGAQLSAPEQATLTDLHRRVAAAPSEGAPRYRDYTMLGGGAYRELLITLPDGRERGDYQSSHWDEPNVLAHARFSERVGYDGARTLLVDEAQSDWHQDGRRRGYGDAPTGTEPPVPDAPFRTSWPALVMKRMIRWAVDNGFDRVAWAPGDVHADRYSLQKQISRIDLVRTSGGMAKPPAGPFERGTLYAYDRAGREVVNRYVNNPDEIATHVGKDAAKRLLDLAEREGTDGGLGARIRTLRDLDLKVGGEGMRGFYDKILPAETQKLIGRYGAKVETSGVPTGSKHAVPPVASNGRPMFDVWGRDERTVLTTADEAEARRRAVALGGDYGPHEPATQPVHGFDITPAMREAVIRDGMPLFSMRDVWTQQVAKRRSTIEDMADTVRRAIVPITTGARYAQAAAAKFANGEADISYRGLLLDKMLQREFTPDERRKMWDAMDDQSLFELELRDAIRAAPLGSLDAPRLEAEARSRFAGKGLDTLDTRQRDVVVQLDALAKAIWQRMQERGLVHPQADGLPFYTPRFFVALADGKAESLTKNLGPGLKAIDPLGLNLSASGPRARDIPITADALRAMRAKYGGEVDLVRDIRTLPVMLAREERAIAGVDLVRAIQSYGDRMGLNLITHEPLASEAGDYRTIDHPAMTELRPLMTDGPDGTRVARLGDDGKPIMVRVPLKVHVDFEGPLRAVLRGSPSKLYKAALALKAGAVQAIMIGPLIHNAVEFARAMPALPGKVATFQVYFDGFRLKRDADYMSNAIGNGLRPIGGSWRADISGIYDEPNLKPGRSVLAKALGAAGDLVRPELGDAMRRSVDAAGHFWHQTMLWDRIADLQVGIYDAMQKKYQAKGFDPKLASQMAAHLANRYAGVLPREALSNAANVAANLGLFSRSYTLGNLGAMKDMVNGMPSYVRAQIERDFSPGAADMAAHSLRQKAIGAFIMDLGLFYVGNSLLQDGVRLLTGDQTLDDVAAGYVRRLGAEVQRVAHSPWEMLNPFGVMQSLTSTNDNEPGKQGRVAMFRDADGTMNYVRNPFGKIGEDMADWLMTPAETLHAKMSTVLKPLVEVVFNTGSFGKPIYDREASGVSGWLANAGRIAEHVAGSQLPVDAVKGAIGAFSGGPHATRDALKAFGPLVGAQTSHGYPGGPEEGVMAAARRQYDLQRSEAMPAARVQLERGDEAGARATLTRAGLSDRDVTNALRSMQNPARAERNLGRTFNRIATPEQQQQLQNTRLAAPPPAAAPAPPPPVAPLTPAQKGQRAAQLMFENARRAIG